jgi:hypothetical protein
MAASLGIFDSSSENRVFSSVEQRLDIVPSIIRWKQIVHSRLQQLKIFGIAIFAYGRRYRPSPPTRRKAMSSRSKFVVAAAIAVLGLAAPAFAQSFNRTDGTGNELPSYYDAGGGLHAGTAPQQTQLAAHRNGSHAFARIK